MKTGPGYPTNPYDPDTPEWQLWVNWNSQKHLVAAATADIDRAMKRRSSAIEKEEAYAQALEKLTGQRP